MPRLRSLDGLRTLAVALVFAHHVDQRLLPGGFIGVDVFFVLSGFLITHLLLREHAATGEISLGRFYMRRLLRLYPALVVVVVVVTPIALHDHIGQPIPSGVAPLLYIEDFWANYHGGDSLLLHTWSLSVEEQFYLLWPAILIYALARGWRIDRIVAGLMAASVLVTWAIFEAHSARLSQIQFLPTSHVMELGSGVLLAVWLRDRVPKIPAALSSFPVAALGLASLVLCLFVLPARWWAFPVATIACWPIVAHLVTSGEGWMARLFSKDLLVWGGRRSYGFYLWHYPILILLARSVSDGWVRAAIALPVTLLITVASWRLVETPVLRYKDSRWAARSQAAINLPAGSSFHQGSSDHTSVP